MAISSGAVALKRPHLASTSSALRNLWFLSTAAVLCNGLFLWVLARAAYIDSFFPQDSRVGIMVFLCWPVWPMGVVFWLRTLIGRWRTAIPLRARHSATAAMLISTLPVVCVVAFSVRNGLSSILVPDLDIIYRHPLTVPALVLALWSIRRDVLPPVAETEEPAS